MFPRLLHRFSDDLIAASVPILFQKVATYDLRYRDQDGNSKPVPFAAYIWKRIDGFIIDYVKKEIGRERIEMSGFDSQDDRDVGCRDWSQ